jgi:hypothetical protein
MADVQHMAMQSVANAERPRLVRSDLQRVIVLDFEGLPDEAPVLVGILRPGTDDVDQVVLDVALADAGRRSHLETATLQDSIRRIVEEAERGGDVLVGWSLHEPEVVHHWCDTDLAERFDALYRDAKREARAWYRQTFPDSAPVGRGRDGATLQRFAEMTGFRVPRRWGSGETAARIRQVRRALVRADGRYRATSKPTKRNWHDLLRHNESDCRATLHVLRTALGGDPPREGGGTC